MNNNTLATWAVIVLLVIAGSVYVVARSHETAPNVGATTTTTSTSTTGTSAPAIILVDYYCSEGTIQASYSGGSTADLKLSDGRTFDLTQGVSGSGVRYVSSDGTVVWDTEGNDGFLQENGTTTYNNCVAGTETSSGSSVTYNDPTGLFSFTYPNIGTLSATLGYTTSWATNSMQSGLVLAEVDIPQSYQPKTNFADAKFTVGTSSDPTAVSDCLTPENGASKTTSTVDMNGTTFTKISESDAGAGNIYATTSYRAVHDGQCYAVEYTIHSSQLGNYPASAGITAFNDATVTGMLEGIAQSFRFNQ